jgi:hypothetical protein
MYALASNAVNNSSSRHVLAEERRERANWLKRGLVASSSLLAIAAALDSAKAIPLACGLPSGGVVNCTGTSYPAGIVYVGFDDLTLNVGSPAGQTGATTVTSGILLESPAFTAASETETLNVGSNVAVTGGIYNGERVEATSYGSAYANIFNAGSVTSTGASGILAQSVAQSYFASTPGYAATYVNNSGSVTAYKYGVAGLARTITISATTSYAVANATVVNTGDVETTGSPPSHFGAVGVGAYGEALSGGYNAYATANASATNSGTVTTMGYKAPGVAAGTNAVAEGYGGNAGAWAYSTVVNSGAVTTYGYKATGVLASTNATAYSYSGTGGETNTASAVSTLTNSGAITTSGDYSSGIRVTTYANAYGGQYAVAAATTTVVNSGAITTAGTYATGIAAYTYASASGTESATATASTSVTNSGAIVTSGDYAFGIDAESQAYAGKTSLSWYANATATTTVTNSSAITTSGYYADGIHATAQAGAYGILGGYATASTAVMNTGDIATGGEGAIGIEAYTRAIGAGVGYGTAYASSYIKNSGAVTAKGDYASGVLAVSYALASGEVYSGRAKATSAVVNSGAINTYGTNAIGVGAYAHAIAQSEAIDAQASAYASASVTNSGYVATGPGSYSLAVGAQAVAESIGTLSSAGAKATVMNSGDILTSGAYESYGLFAVTKATALPDYGLTWATSVTKVVNSGDIYTYGTNSDGILASATSQSGVWYAAYYNGLATSYASTSVTNSGAIATYGDAADGIRATSRASGYAYYGGLSTAYTTVNNSGAITTAGFDSAAIDASSDASSYSSVMRPPSYTTAVATTTVVNSGALTTSGDFADGIAANSDAFADGGYTSTATATTTVNNSGAITTSGFSSAGIDAWSNAFADGFYSATATATTTVTNSGAITTSGDYAAGILATSYASAFGPKVTADATTVVTNQAAITTSGYAAPGIVAKSGAIANSYTGGPAVATAMTSVVNSGHISVSGEGSDGIDASSYAGANSSNTGSSAVASTTVTNSGKIAVTGDYGNGIAATALAFSSYGSSSSTLSVTNSGSISASGEDAVGVSALADQVTITNAAGGSITGGTGTDGAGIWALGDSVTVNNSGTIGSLNDHAVVLYSDGATVLNNKTGGTVTGFVTMNAPSVKFYNAGTWIARGGNSNFKPWTGGSSIVVNSGTTLVVGNQVFLGLGEFENAGLLSLSSVNANQGARPAYETLEITGDFVGNPTSMLEVGSNMTTTADVLKVDGPITGTTHIQVDELGAPGLTSGNGILVVDASTGTTSSSNFSLVSNTVAGTLLDNAYEYSLGLVPGTGGHGGWYLTSRLYPGTFEFSGVPSSGIALANLANGSLLDFFGAQEQGPQQQASDAAPVKVASTDNSFVPTSPLGTGVAGWGRYNYASLNMSPSGSKYGNYALDASTGNIGVDLTVNANGQTGIFGLMVSPFGANASFDNFGSAHMSSSGTGISGYLLWIGGPWHAGMMFSNDILSTHFTDTYIHTNAAVKMNGFGFQAAGSYDGWLDDGVYFDPGASISLQHLGGGSFLDGAGDTVSFGDTSSIIGRLNIKVGTSFDTGSVVLKPYGELGVNYEFDGNTLVTLGNYSYTSSLKGATVKVGGGFTADITEYASFFANADYIGGDKQSGVETFVGVRVLR